MTDKRSGPPAEAVPEGYTAFAMREATELMSSRNVKDWQLEDSGYDADGIIRFVVRWYETTTDRNGRTGDVQKEQILLYVCSGDPAQQIGALRVVDDVVKAPQAFESAQFWFSWLTAVAPKRITKEELGDAIESLQQMHTNGASPAQLRWKVWTTVGWTVLNAIREVMSAFLGKSVSGK